MKTNIQLWEVGKHAEAVEKLRTLIVAPYVKVSSSNLGGDEHANVWLHISADAKGTWTNDIYHNSRYGIFSIDRDGTMECSSIGRREMKFRKCQAKTFEDVAARITKWLATAPAK